MTRQLRYRDIPTNLIVGFLGVGKTTAIRQLLAQVPVGERWAVLVNEFGEVGIDGALLHGERVAVREVAGGCLCCVAASGLQLGLNQLIRDHAPSRILIEPTGLGHSAQILEALESPPFDEVLDIRATIGLLDARHLADLRYREHPVFQDQLFLADVLVANKRDGYQEEDMARFIELARAMQPAKAELATVERGVFPREWLDIPRSAARHALFPEAHRFLQRERGERVVDIGWLRVAGFPADGYRSCGWVIDAVRCFSLERLQTLATQRPLRRIKGVLRTDKGWQAINAVDGCADWQAAAPQGDSRLEIIHSEPLDWSVIDGALRKALIKS